MRRTIDNAGSESVARAPTPREMREALPRGFVLDEDGVTVRRDARVCFRDSWVLLLALVCFGAAGIGFFWWSFPRGTAGFVRFAIVVGVVLVAGGIVGPLITRALNRK